MKRISPRQLVNYSASATTFLLLGNQAGAQVSYHDFDPDIILEFEADPEGFHASDTVLIDLNEDGENDLSFRIGGADSCSGCEPRFWGWGNALNTNSLAMDYYTWSTSDGYITSKSFVKPFLVDAMINESLIFQNGLDKRLNGSSGGSSEGGWDAIGPWQTDAERFIGFTLSISDETHYGWMRLICKNAYLKLLDYAYELTPDTPIETKVYGPSSVQENMSNDDVSIIMTGNTCFVQVNEPVSEFSIISIINISGEFIFQKEITQQQNTFELNLANGIYIATIQSGNKMYSQKIVIYE
ncbi:MAG: T9SS type A sorting domain-containing protein [Chitinophagales bacterium]|nr:T9SS type A sorting domain-containing protein [Chitinophagales bacterium]